MAMKHLYKIYPKRALRGITPREISEPTVLEGLNRQEFLKCFNGGELYAIVNDEEIHLTECNYEKAESLFVKKEDLIDPEITFTQPDIDKLTAPMQDHITKMTEDIVTVTASTMEPDAVNKNGRSYGPDMVEGLQHYSKDETSVAEPVKDTVDEVTKTVESAVVEEVKDIVEKTIETVEEAVEDAQNDTKNPVEEPKDTAQDAQENTGNTLQQSQQYNKNHNNQSGQSNYRNQKHGKSNKGKFVINN